MSATVKHIEIVKISDGQYKKNDLVAVEEPLEIRLSYGPLKQREEMKLAVTMRTPGNDLELTLGFLFTESIIESYKDVLNIRHCESVEKPEETENVVKVELSQHLSFNLETLNRNFYTSSSCGVCGKSSIESVFIHSTFPIHENPLKTSSNTIIGLPEALKRVQSTFEHTGGIHASALFHSNGVLSICREDVGRHNALDKVLGAAIFESNIPLSNQILLLSGRGSFELIQKAVRAGIPIVACVGAPSSLAVELAQEKGLTLIGFLRESSFNIYCGEERIVYE